MKNKIRHLDSGDFEVVDEERERLTKEVEADDAEAARLLKTDPKYSKDINPGRAADE